MRGDANAIRRLKARAPLFAALGDETRLAVLARLCEAGPRSITQLAAGSKVTRQAITKHLEVLHRAGLVRDVRRGRERVWQFEANRLNDARECLDQISNQWNTALERLRSLVES